MSGSTLVQYLRAGTGVTIDEKGEISATGTGGGDITDVIAGDGLSGGGAGPGSVTLNLAVPNAGVAEIRLLSAYLAVLFEQEDAIAGDGGDLVMRGQTTLDVNGTGGRVVIESGEGGLNDGDVVIQVPGDASITLDGGNGSVVITATNPLANGIQLVDLSTFGIRLNTSGPVHIGGSSSSAEHVINGLSDPAAGAAVEYWVVDFNGNQRKVAMLAV